MSAGVQPPQGPGEPEGKTASADDLERDKERILQIRKQKREADIPWFTQKANKVLEAQESEHRETWCPRDQPEKESKRKKEKKEKHRVTKFLRARPNSFIFKGTFIPCLIHRGK